MSKSTTPATVQQSNKERKNPLCNGLYMGFWKSIPQFENGREFIKVQFSHRMICHFTDAKKEAQFIDSEQPCHYKHLLTCAKSHQHLILRVCNGVRFVRSTLHRYSSSLLVRHSNYRQIQPIRSMHITRPMQIR